MGFTCKDYVAKTPADFEDAYWTINGFREYHDEQDWGTWNHTQS